MQIHPIEDEDADTVLKGFKYECLQVKEHFDKEVDGTFATDKTPDALSLIHI